MLILTAFHFFMPSRGRPHHKVMLSRDSRCCDNPYRPHPGGPQLSIPDRSWPCPLPSSGWGSPPPGAGPALRQLLQEPTLQAAPPPPTRIPPRPPSGVAEPELSLRLPRLGTYGDGGANAALGSLPAAGLSGQARTQQAAPRST